MRPKSYPREPLAKLRAKEASDAAGALAKAVRTREEAERVARSIEKARDTVEAATRTMHDAEQAALERGELRAGDLVQRAGWATRVASEGAKMDARVANSAERARASRAVEEVARGAVAGAHAKEQVVEKDAARWHERQREGALERDEEDASVAWRKK